MGNLSNLFISQSFISVLHTGNNNTLSAQYTDIQDGLGNSSGVSLKTNGDLSMSGSLTASLQQGYVWVGNASGRTTTVPTSSFGGGGSATWPVSGTPSGIVSGSSQLTASYDTRYALSGSGGGTLPSGVVSGSGQISGLGFVSSSVTGSSVITASFNNSTRNLTFTKGDSSTFAVNIPDASGSVLPSGVVSGSSQLTSSYDLRYALSGSGGGGGATLGSNTFIGNQTITGSLFISSSGVIDIIAPNFPGAPAPGGVSITASLAVNGNFAVNGGNFVVGQINTPKIVGNGSPGLDIVSNVQIYNDGNINNARILGVSGSVHVSQSLYTGDLYVGGKKQFNVGTFLSNVSQSGSANVSQSMNFETTDISSGVSIVSNSRITLANSGTYNIQFSAQIDRVSGSGTDTVHIWLKKNDTNVTATAGAVTISGAASAAKTIAAWNYVVDAVANDYYELCWESTDNRIQLINQAAGGNIPSTPSIILTVTQVR